MKFKGFIGASYQLDSLNVDAQACVNLYPEIIESGAGKAAQVAYLRGTPGLEGILEVGDGPLRLVHVDSIGRIFVVSGNRIFRAIPLADWELKIKPTAYADAVDIDQDPGGDVDTTAHSLTVTGHGYYTGLKVHLASTGSLPTGLTVETDYWVIVVNNNSFKLATSLANAVAGTNLLLADRGAGVMSVLPQIPGYVTGIRVGDIDVADDELTASDHDLYTGLKVRLSVVGPVPTGLALLTDYYVIRTSNGAFKLATSIASASAGTADVDITEVSSDEWMAQLLTATGEDGGDPFTMSTNTGEVRAASMSFGGDGTDSSTIFVDGANNYLFRDDDGDTTLDVLGGLPFAEIVFNLTDDVTVASTTDVDNLTDGGTLTLTDSTSDFGSPSAIPTSQIWIHFYTLNAKDYKMVIRAGMGASLTTEQFVYYMKYGFYPGKFIVYNNFSQFGVIPGALVPVPRSQFTFTGGGASESAITVAAADPTGPFTAEELTGLEYGSVPTATDIVWSDGYFILSEGNTNRFRVSGLQDFNIDTLSFASSEGSPDIVLALEILNRYLYVFNEKTTEVYANTGNADFPFERIQGGFIEVGCAAAGSVVKAGSSICFLGRSVDGEGIVYALDGLQPQRISTHAIEQAIRSYADTSAATAYSYQSGGHAFYVLNFDEATWVYDFSSRLWHQRAYTNAGVLERHRAQHCAYALAHKVHLVGDYETNKLYAMSEDVYSDDGDAITRLRAFPYVSNGRNRVFCSSLQIDMETGVGLDGGVQGSNPTVMLDWSNDNGNTWSSESWALADAGSGQIGDHTKRVIWNRLGSFRSRVFRIKITDPVKVRLIDADIEIEGGSN
ncbi:MAG: hypothetical protein HC883_00100 [Bdellovibrionaceae bacterium]|nr:hypothetical protein [Pseudobdellovibrionaceae bacterium]